MQLFPTFYQEVIIAVANGICPAFITDDLGDLQAYSFFPTTEDAARKLLEAPPEKFALATVRAAHAMTENSAL